MKKGYSGPKSLTEYVLYQSENKAAKQFVNLLIQGFLAGLYIAIGAIGYFKIIGYTGNSGVGNFFGAMVFPLGIIAILVMQAELFTSDTMVMVLVYQKKLKLIKILRILLVILIANLLGSIFAAMLTQTSGIFNDNVMDIIIHKSLYKVNMPVVQMFSSAFLCNIIVSTGVCLSYSCKDEIAKIVVLWLAITVFVLSGTEHVVANMYYLFVAYFGGADITLLQIFYNLSIVTVGNFIAGGVFVAGINYLLAYKEIKK